MFNGPTEFLGLCHQDEIMIGELLIERNEFQLNKLLFVGYFLLSELSYACILIFFYYPIISGVIGMLDAIDEEKDVVVDGKVVTMISLDLDHDGLV